LKDHAGGDPWRDIFVMFNACAEAVAVTVPDGRYTVVCREGVIDEQSTETLSGSVVTVAPQSALILYQQ
jgi:pullulanase